MSTPADVDVPVKVEDEPSPAAATAKVEEETSPAATTAKVEEDTSPVVAAAEEEEEKPKGEEGAATPEEEQPAAMEPAATSPTSLLHRLTSCGTDLGGLVEENLKTILGKSRADTPPTEAVAATPKDDDENAATTTTKDGSMDSVMRQITSCGNGISGLVEENIKTILCDASRGGSGSRAVAPSEAEEVEEPPAEQQAEAQDGPKETAQDGATEAAEEAGEPSEDKEREDPPADIAALQAALAAKEQEASAFKAMVASQAAEIELLKDTIEHSASLLIPSALAAKKAQISDLVEQARKDKEDFVAAMAAKDETMEKERQKAAAAVATMDAEVASAQKAVEAEKQAREESVAGMEEAKQALAAAVAEEKKATDAALAEVEALTATIVEREEAMVALKQEQAQVIEAKEGELVAAQERIASLEADLCKATEQIDAFGSPMKHLELYLAGREERIATLEAALAEKETYGSFESAEEGRKVEDANPAAPVDDAKVVEETATAPAKLVEVASPQSGAGEPVAVADARDDAEAVAVAAE